MHLEKLVCLVMAPTSRHVAAGLMEAGLQPQLPLIPGG